MIDIKEYEPLWGEWYLARSLGIGPHGAVYIFCREELGETYFAAVKHIHVHRDTPAPTPGGDACGEVPPDCDPISEGQQAQKLNQLLAALAEWCQLSNVPGIVRCDAYTTLTRVDGVGFDVLIRTELLTSLPFYLQTHSLTLRNVLQMGLDLSAALDMLQHAGIVHGGVAAENILVDGSGTYKLCDCGVAAALGSVSVSHSSDLAALGNILYMLMDDEHLFGPETASPPSEKADAWLSAVLMSACHAEKSHMTAGELYTALSEYQGSRTARELDTVIMHHRLSRGVSQKRAQPQAMRGTWGATDTGGGGCPPMPGGRAAPPPPYVESNMTSAVGGAAVPPPILVEPVTAEPEIGRVPVSTKRRPGRKKNTNLPKTQPDGPVLESQMPPASNFTKHNDSEETECHTPASVDKLSRGRRSLVTILIVAGAVVIALIIGGGIIFAGMQRTPPTPAPTPEPTTVQTTVQPTATPEKRTLNTVLKDSGIRSAVCGVLGMTPDEPITEARLNAVTELRIRAADGISVESLDDLRLLRRLSVLELSGQRDLDLSPLSDLGGLTVLNLSGTQIGEHIIFFKDLINLEKLDVSNTGITSLTFAVGLTHLCYLNISGNAIQDVTPLSNLTMLTRLDADDTEITNWIPVETISQVTGRPEDVKPDPTAAPTPSPIPSLKPTQAPVTPRPQTSRPVVPPPPALLPPTPSANASDEGKKVPVAKITLSETNMVHEVGSRARLTAQISPQNATEQTIKWISSNQAVVSIDQNGNLTAAGVGTATITASCGGQSASCVITVS